MVLRGVLVFIEHCTVHRLSKKAKNKCLQVIDLGMVLFGLIRVTWAKQVGG